MLEWMYLHSDKGLDVVVGFLPYPENNAANWTSTSEFTT
jgi:hypothetical protein